MKILFILDPLDKLNSRWDNSLRLAGELNRRGHECYTAGVSEISARPKKIRARCRLLISRGRTRFRLGPSQNIAVDIFNLIFIRKEPPVDKKYIQLTYLLEKVSKKTPVLNNPRGIRETNEKLSILNFPKWIPKTVVTSSAEAILEFQRHLKKPVVVKPLDQKGGQGIFLLKDSSPRSSGRLRRATRQGRERLMAQEFLKGGAGEKRIVLLHGEIFCYYEKRARGNDFRANLSLGATFHKSPLTAREKKICRDLKPFLLKRGLEFAGIDVLNGKLIEINVTSPAGVTEAIHLEPHLRLVEAWADFLEGFSRR